MSAAAPLRAYITIKTETVLNRLHYIAAATSAANNDDDYDGGGDRTKSHM